MYWVLIKSNLSGENLSVHELPSHASSIFARGFYRFLYFPGDSPEIQANHLQRTGMISFNLTSREGQKQMWPRI